MNRSKLRIIAILVLLFQFNLIFGQVNCDVLTRKVESTFTLHSVTSLLLDSSWLYEVNLYYTDGKYFVVAVVQHDNFMKSKYIFCGIPKTNWNNFYFGQNDPNSTYGERFHKYIIDYKCDCY